MKILKWIIIVVLALGLLGFGGFQYLIYNTKKASPEKIANFEDRDVKLSVNYCAPYKNGRDIFGGLEPYGKVWRTGANEATTFTTSHDLTIDGKQLKAGTYTLWTIPNEKNWEVIFNKKMYGWGVDMSMNALREAEHDALIAKVPVSKTDNVVEQFNISFEYHTNLVLEWDLTRIVVPIEYEATIQ